MGFKIQKTCLLFGHRGCSWCGVIFNPSNGHWKCSWIGIHNFWWSKGIWNISQCGKMEKNGERCSFDVGDVGSKNHDIWSKKPYNKWINQTARGRHAPCTRWVDASGQSKGRAGDAPGLSLPGQALRPCSLVIHALYGREKETKKDSEGKINVPAI